MIKKLESDEVVSRRKEGERKEEQRNIEGYLQKLYERELTVQEVQKGLGVSEEQLKQMYVLFQKAKHFDRMQARMKKLMDMMERQRREFEQQQVQYQHMDPKNLHGHWGYTAIGQEALEFHKIQKPPVPHNDDILRQLPLLHHNLISSEFPLTHPTRINSSHSYVVAQQSDQQQQQYAAINEGLFKGLMRELQIKLQIYHNNAKYSEVRQVQSKIHKLQEVYHSSTNMIILNYMLKEFREELDI